METRARKKLAIDNVQTSIDTKSPDRTVKRPARGYHKFRNGMLNVTPKGGEIELVKRNQKSPLLCLSPEIRNRIWRFALGGREIRQINGFRNHGVFLPEPRERPNAFALLRVCRQIYVETAIIPFRANTFSVFWSARIKASAKAFSKYQRSQITDLLFESCGHDNVWLSWMRTSMALSNFSALPGLRRIKFQIFPSFAGTAGFSKIETDLRSLQEFALLNGTYEVVFGEMDVSWDAFHEDWMGTED